MATSTTIKKYVGAAGDALAVMWQRLRTEPEEAPPVGSQEKVPQAATIGGISTGTILLIAAAWFLMKRRK